MSPAAQPRQQPTTPVRRLPALVAVVAGVAFGASGCEGAAEPTPPSAREGPDPTVATEQAETDAGQGTPPGPERTSEATPEPVALPELTRDDLAWEDRDIPVGDLDYRVTRVPAGFELTGDTPHEAGEGRSGWTLDFDATDDVVGSSAEHAYFEVQIVQTDDVHRVREVQDRLAEREPVRTEDVRGRPGLTYRSGEQRTVRVLRQTGTLILVRGVGLSRGALLEVAAGVRRST